MYFACATWNTLHLNELISSNAFNNERIRGFEMSLAFVFNSPGYVAQILKCGIPVLDFYFFLILSLVFSGFNFVSLFVLLPVLARDS